MMRQTATDGDTLVTAERSAATERVSVVPVTMIAEPDAPVCTCPEPRISWGDVYGNDPRFVPWFCINCCRVGAIAFPRSDDWPGFRLPPDLCRRASVAADQLVEALGSDVDLLAVFARYADQIFTRRNRVPGVETVKFRLGEAVEQMVVEIRAHYQEIERDRRYREALRQNEHAALIKKLKTRVSRRAVKLAERVAEERGTQPPGGYAVVVRGSDIMVRLIYGLVDPMEPDRIRYVGQTIRGAHTRYLGHVGRPDQTPRGRWIASLIEDGRYPDMVLIEQVAAGADITAIEMHWIGEMWKRGEADLNTSGPAGVRKEVAS